MVKAKESRRYDASRRRRRADANRERVIEVATRVFAERGYAETTMATLASEAGVAVPTIYAGFGSKRGLLSAVLDRLVSNEPGPTPILRTGRAREVLEEPDPRRMLTRFSEHMTEIQDRVGPIFHVMKHAARTDPEVRELYVRAQENRFANLETLARKLADRGALRAGLTVSDAGRTLWLLASPQTRRMMETHAGWTAEHYRCWLADTLIAALLAPDVD